MKAPAALFPFDSELLPAVKLFEKLQDKYMLRELISPSGYGLTGRDAGYARNHPPVGLTVTDTLNSTDPAWDALLLIGTSEMGAKEDSDLENAAEGALHSGKSVLYFDDVGTNVPEKLVSLAELHPGKVEFYGNGCFNGCT